MKLSPLKPLVGGVVVALVGCIAAVGCTGYAQHAPQLASAGTGSNTNYTNYTNDAGTQVRDSAPALQNEVVLQRDAGPLPPNCWRSPICGVICWREVCFTHAEVASATAAAAPADASMDDAGEADGGVETAACPSWVRPHSESETLDFTRQTTGQCCYRQDPLCY
jgi:hypothetical protein